MTRGYSTQHPGSCLASSGQSIILLISTLNFDWDWCTQGTAAFTSAHTIEVGGQSLDFAAAVIATGGRASIPPIPGLEGVGYMTNDSFYNQTELPGRLAVIGAGPIGEQI